MKTITLNNVSIRPYNSVSPSTYNPRETDPQRLELIGLSLRKLGFLIPIYVDTNNEILSGHQRHLIARKIGVEQVPIYQADRAFDLNTRKTINIAFNRGTNDMEASTTPAELTANLETSDYRTLADKLPDIAPNTEAFYPCLYGATKHSVKELVAANLGEWKGHATAVNKMLAKRGLHMPIIVDPDLKIVNGIGRLVVASHRKQETAWTVMLTKEQAEFARIMLNLISMDFNIHGRYADYLRYGSFRRASTGGVADLGYGFTMFAWPKKSANQVPLSDPRNVLHFERTHGKNILDFGAGRLRDTKALRQAGFDVTPFEPYHCPDGDTIDYDVSREINTAFLAAVTEGKQWHSIFISAVLNSVPFLEDRVHIVQILNALAQPYGTPVYASANSHKQVAWKSFSGVDKRVGAEAEFSLRFQLSYESRTILSLGTSGEQGKVQKFHSAKDFKDLFETGFGNVKVGYHGRGVTKAFCLDPLPVDAKKLRAALEFEFDLPYPEDRRMDLADLAISSFEKRLGITL